jgi:thiol-disulfide isomerase/thioredoxin
MIINKTIKALTLTIFLTIVKSILFAQSDQPKLFQIGDKLPGIILKGFLKDSLKQKKISELYHNKLLLIDLSATWCAPCVKAWPELDSLKALFRDRLEILAVTQEKRFIVQKFLSENFKSKELNFDFITDNKSTNPALFYGFPHKYVPQFIWINSEGVIIASTDEYKVTQGNIEKAIKENKIDLPIKKDVMDFHSATYELRDSHSLVHSFLTHFVTGIPSSSGYFPAQNIDEVKGIHRILLTNMDVRWLYWYAAFHHTIAMSNNERIIWDMPDSTRLNYDYLFYDEKNGHHTDGDEWYKSHAFCYQIETQSLRSEDQLMQQIINDLNVGLNLYGRFEKRMVPCWILKSNKPNILTKGNDPKIVYDMGIVCSLQNQPISKLVYFLNKYLISGQIVDDTGLKGNIDVDLTGLNGDQNTVEMLNNLLRKYSLNLVKSKRELDVFVISERLK